MLYMNTIDVKEVSNSKTIVVNMEYTPCKIEDILQDIIALTSTLETDTDVKFRYGSFFHEQRAPYSLDSELHALYNEPLSEDEFSMIASAITSFIFRTKISPNYENKTLEIIFPKKDSVILSAILTYAYFRCQHRKNVQSILDYGNALNFSTGLMFNTSYEEVKPGITSKVNFYEFVSFFLKFFQKSKEVIFDLSESTFGGSEKSYKKVYQHMAVQTMVPYNLFAYNPDIKYKITVPSKFKLQTIVIADRDSGNLVKSSLLPAPESHIEDITPKNPSYSPYAAKLVLNFDDVIMTNVAIPKVNVLKYGKDKVHVQLSAHEERHLIDKKVFKASLSLASFNDDDYEYELRKRNLPVRYKVVEGLGVIGLEKGKKVDSKYYAVAVNVPYTEEKKYVSANPLYFNNYFYFTNEPEISLLDADKHDGEEYFLKLAIEIKSETYIAKNVPGTDDNVFVPMLSLYSASGDRLFDISGNVIPHINMLINVDKIPLKNSPEYDTDIFIKGLVLHVLDKIEFYSSFNSIDTSPISESGVYVPISSVTAFFESVVDLSNVTTVSLF